MHMTTVWISAILMAVASPEVAATHEACVDINTAGLERLQEIKHIGPVRAKQIIALRRVRPFASVDELVRVKGIAKKRLADIKQEGIACVKKRTSRVREEPRLLSAA